MKTLRSELGSSQSRYRFARIAEGWLLRPNDLDDGLADRIIREALSGAPVRAERLADVCGWSAERMEWHQYLEGQRLLLVREKAKRAARARARAIARQTRLNEEWQANEDRIQREWDLAHPDPHHPPAPVGDYPFVIGPDPAPDPPPFTPEQDAAFHARNAILYPWMKP
jgi:hypothetical protein